jgi:hypothetical protein
MKIKKKDYNEIIKLYVRQNWLTRKKEQLFELIEFCGDNENKNLIYSLLERFYYLTPTSFSEILDDMSEYIVNKSGFTENKTQLLSMTYDDEADSSQKILDTIKIPIYEKGWRAVKTVNNFGKGVKNCDTKKKTQIIIIDEFIGSGKTLKGRIDWLRKNTNQNFELKCCFVAGLKETINLLKSEGIDIFCSLQLDKGITGFFRDGELERAKESMKCLEEKLAKKINEKELKGYSFGYGSAEALYTMEGCNGNTPNSVFPIFWWLKDCNEKDRDTLLTRYETGF